MDSSSTPGAVGDAANATGDPSGALGEAGSGSVGSAAPNMIGDQGPSGTRGGPGGGGGGPGPGGPGGGMRQRGRAAEGETENENILQSPQVQRARAQGTLQISQPVAGHGAFKITENDSPRPQDRVFLTYNYFQSVNTFGGPPYELNRWTLGAEKTFLDGDASVEFRLPILLKDGSSGGPLDGFGDLTLISKFAFLNNRETGNVFSGGLVLTVPTGRSIIVADGSDIHNVLLQPWFGGLVNCDRFYAMAFSAIIIPVVAKDSCFITNDLSLGYRLWQTTEDRAITAVIPTVEGHLVTPVNHTGVDDGGLVGFPDQFTITAGVHFRIRNRGYLTLAGAFPLTGPRPFDGEFICQINLLF
jgi:hypothetical protein